MSLLATPTTNAEEATIPKANHVDVLIIGAGPAGVMFANALQSAGVTVRIVDKRPVGLAAGQADGCQPRTLEIFQSYGLLEGLKRRGYGLYKSVFYNPSPNGGVQRTQGASVVNAPSLRYSFGITLHQGGIENIFLESMREKGLNVEHSTFPTHLEISNDPTTLEDPNAYIAKVTLEHADRIEDTTESVHAKFVLGSDGAHSWTRKSLGIELEGDVTDSVWGVIDMVPDTDLPDVRCQAFIRSERGNMFIIPREDELVRLYVQQMETAHLIDPKTGRIDKERSCPEAILEQARKMLSPYKMNIKDGKLRWWTVYVAGQRVAKRYSVHERAFIAGDACHTHSPKAGQGLNASMGDTHNLAWKVVYVLRGWARPSILQTYEFERRAFAQALIDFDKGWNKLFDEKATSGDGEGVTHEMFYGMFLNSGPFTSGTGIHYNPSLIVNASFQSSAHKLIVGERVPPQIFLNASNAGPVEIQDLLPADTRFKVLIFGGDVGVEADRARLQEVADKLARPDSFLQRFGRKPVGHEGGFDTEVFDVVAFSSAKQDKTDWFAFPPRFRPHWKHKTFFDDTDMQGWTGGGGYAKYGIDEHEGAIVVVRPDGYVGIVAPLDAVGVVEAYFADFMLST